MPYFADDYIRGKLNLNIGTTNQQLKKLLHESDQTISASPGWLDHILRALLAILRNKDELSSYELEVFSEGIRGVWNRYIEDRIFKSYY